MSNINRVKKRLFTVLYRILLGVWSPNDGTKLYATSQTAIEEVGAYQCIGFGDYLAHYLVRQHVAAGMPQREALVLAAYALSGIKDFVPNCGGMSIYVLIQNDGRIGILSSLHEGTCRQIQEYAKAYDFTTRELLIALANEDSEDADFERHLRAVLVPRLLEVRRRWTKARQQRQAAFREANPSLDDTQAAHAFRELSMGLAPDFASSPE
jgi:hypothetical protein